MNEAEISYGICYDVDVIRVAAKPLRELRGLGRPYLSRFIEYDTGGF